MSDNQKEPVDAQCCEASRMQGKEVLKDIIHRLHTRANDLQKLHDALPEKLPSELDEAVWRIAISLERH